MADNKKHHFVPKFYLRMFSEDGCSINLFNVKAKRRISRAPLKNQCYRDYFYGKDGIHEKALGQIEGAAAEALRRLVRAESMPPMNDFDFSTILIYLMVQRFRTGYQVDALNEMVDAFAKRALQHQCGEEELGRMTISLSGLSNLAVRHAMTAYVIIHDLQWLIVKAPAGSEFLTSDTPVVLANPFFPKRAGAARIGIAHKGLQLFFPVTPRLAITLFDRDVYRTNGPMVNAGLVVALPADVHQMNILHAASSYENIYFVSDAARVDAAAREAARHRPPRKNTQRVFEKNDSILEKRELIFTSQESASFDMTVSFLREKKSAQRWRTDFQKLKQWPAVVVRDRDLMDTVRNFEDRESRGEALPPLLEFLQGKRVPAGPIA